jgi:hypothetical protein
MGDILLYPQGKTLQEKTIPPDIPPRGIFYTVTKAPPYSPGLLAVPFNQGEAGRIKIWEHFLNPYNNFEQRMGNEL